MSKFTPGPWQITGRTVYALNDKGFNRFSARVEDAHTSSDELEATAQLIAAAPELLDAIQNLLNAAGKTDPQRWHDARQDGAAAIAKATGEQA